MRKALNYFYIYTIGIILLIVLGVFFLNIYKVLILIWLPCFPLFIIFYEKYKNPNKFQTYPWPHESKASKVSIMAIILAVLNTIPTVIFFLGIPISIYCFISFLYSVANKKKKSSIISGVALAIVIASFLVLFYWFNRP